MYSRNLKDPMTLNKKDRFDAEMWIGLNNPNAATLCQLFVDYNTKGKFQIQKETNMPKNYVHTLAYNLPSEVEKTTKLIYEQNNPEDFKHIICDLGFPIIKGDEIPGNFSGARQVNTEKLKEICIKYGSTYLKMENIGVSQNWTQIINHCKLKDDDVIIGADPDERTMDNGWINAMAKVLRSGKIGMVSLMMPEQVKEMPRWSYQNFSIDGVWAIELNGGINWALIGFKGEFLKKMGDMPFPADKPKYGYIEHFVRIELNKYGYRLLFLPNHKVYHTDYPKDEGSSKLLREWKNFIIFGDIHQRSNPQMMKQYGQLEFTKFLDLRKRGVL